MKSAALGLVAVLLSTSSAQAEPNLIADPLPAALAPVAPTWTAPVRPEAPRQHDAGTLWILGGTGLLIGGAANLATSPICASGAIRSSARTPCLGLSIGFGVGLLAAGIPLVAVGAARRAEWLTWARRVTEGRW